MNDSQSAIISKVRMGVRVRRRAVGGPPRMAYGYLRGGQGVGAEMVFKIRELASFLSGADSAVSEHGHARRVVPPVFKAAQATEDDVQGAISVIALVLVDASDISDDSTHGPQLTSVGNFLPKLFSCWKILATV
jgi:hypothetical protein